MTERWVPVLAAVLGLIGGMGGAAVGGYVANKGQEQQFEHERATEVRDLRIDTYVNFLRAAEREHSQPSATDDRVIHTAEAEVSLVAADAAVRKAASTFTNNAVFASTEDEYTQLRNTFIALAQRELNDGR